MTRVQVQIGSVRPRTNLFNNPRRWHPTRRPSPIFTPSAPRSGPLAPALKKIRSVLKLMSKNLHTQMCGQWRASVRGRPIMTTLLPPNNDGTRCPRVAIAARDFPLDANYPWKKNRAQIENSSARANSQQSREERAQLDNICRGGRRVSPLRNAVFILAGHCPPYPLRSSNFIWIITDFFPCTADYSECYLLIMFFFRSVH